MKKLSFLLLTIVTLDLTAQTSTTGEVPEASIKGKKVLLVPFEPKMYLSDINRDLAIKNELSSKDIAAKFRAGLDQNIFVALKASHTPISFYTMEQEEAIKELSYIYNSIGYKYELMPQQEVVEKETLGKRLMSKFDKTKEEETYIEAGIKDGQIVSQVDNREKYMQTKISNDNLIASLNQKYAANSYIFISELDIKKGADDRYHAQEHLYKREIKVHYTIFNEKGNILDAGAIKSLLSTTQNDLSKIIKEHFSLIAQKIAEKLENSTLSPSN